MAALSRFISISTDNCLPFFNVLRGNKMFEWKNECKEAFKSIKRHLSTPPVLAKPITGETLFLYLAVLENAISAALVREEGKHQQPVYYVSKRLLGAESRYPPLEKLALSLIHASCKFRPYFQTHPIRVLADQPLRQVLSKPDGSRRLIKWSIELGQLGTTYHPRTSIKGKALADFLIEGIIPNENPITLRDTDTWKLYVDGASNEHGSGARCVLPTEANEIIKEIHEGFCGDHARRGGAKYAVVAVDFFTNWTEAELVVSITCKKVLDFVVKSIICKFGIPIKIVSNNGTLFDGDLFTEFCERNKIIKSFSSVSRPQANRQVEVVNKTLKDTIKKNLNAAKGRCIDELP
ncbi:uncharacterized protein LOC133034475 [Cannabis sativa]|uniref:uncharacterized protein LOC133034475 n=1 Tax=Cannabis sativa TaxID=3483 RepID=UPI0029CA5485|nr:uncharacterized protein LOC133034475 [Cannabis sativa]